MTSITDNHEQFGRMQDNAHAQGIQAMAYDLILVCKDGQKCFDQAACDFIFERMSLLLGMEPQNKAIAETVKQETKVIYMEDYRHA